MPLPPAVPGMGDDGILSGVGSTRVRWHPCPSLACLSRFAPSMRKGSCGLADPTETMAGTSQGTAGRDARAPMWLTGIASLPDQDSFSSSLKVATADGWIFRRLPRCCAGCGSAVR